MRIRDLFIFVGMFCVANATTAQVKSPVKWVFSVEPIGKKEFKVIFTANLDYGWHIYSQFLEDGGPLPTSVSFTKSDDFKLIGKVEETGTPVRSYDSTFMMNITWFSNTALFSQKIKLKSSAANIKGRIEFMACNGEMCLPPDGIDFSLGAKTEVQN